MATGIRLSILTEPASTTFITNCARTGTSLTKKKSTATETEGGFTTIDCQSSNIIQDGANFAGVAGDDTRLQDGVPTLQTDWWNYGGLTRDVSLVEVPDQFVDDYALQLKRGTRTEVEGWVHVDGAVPETPVTLSIPERQLSQTANLQADGRARFHLQAADWGRWCTGNPT